MTRLAAIVIAKNAAATITHCLKHLHFCDEIIVILDAATTDSTAQLAEKYADKTITRAWQGYGQQKNYGLARASGEWVLFVDADEEITSGLADEITAVISRSAHTIYWLRIITVFLGRPLPHLYGHNARLFKKDAARWTDSPVHEQLETNTGEIVKLGDAISGVLARPLIHYSHATIGSYLASMHHYTSLDARRMKETGQHRSGRVVSATPFLPWLLAVKQCAKLLLFRRGWLDGWAGIVWSIMSSYYEWEMARKYLAEAKNSNQKLKAKSVK